MNFAYSPKTEDLLRRVRSFMDEHIVPRQRQWHEEVHAGQSPVSFMEDLKAGAQAEGLWNLFLPGVSGLSNVEYAPLGQAFTTSPVKSPTAAGYAILNKLSGISQTNLKALQQYTPPAPSSIVTPRDR